MSIRAALSVSALDIFHNRNIKLQIWHISKLVEDSGKASEIVWVFRNESCVYLKIATHIHRQVQMAKNGGPRSVHLSSFCFPLHHFQKNLLTATVDTWRYHGSIILQERPLAASHTSHYQTQFHLQTLKSPEWSNPSQQTQSASLALKDVPFNQYFLVLKLSVLLWHCVSFCLLSITWHPQERNKASARK